MGQGTCMKSPDDLVYTLPQRYGFARLQDQTLIVESQVINQVGNYTLSLTIGLRDYPLCTSLTLQVPVSILSLAGMPVLPLDCPVCTCPPSKVIIIVLGVLIAVCSGAGFLSGRKYEYYKQQKCKAITPQESISDDS